MARTTLKQKSKSNKKEQPIHRQEWIKREPTTELGRRIICATVEEFAAKGVLGARIAQITRLAGTSDPAFYWYFHGIKQAALYIMSEYYWTPLNQRLDHYQHVLSDPKQLFEAILQSLIQSSADDPNRPWLAVSKVFRIVVAQMRNPALLPESMLDTEYIGFLNRLEEIIKTGQQKKIFTNWLRPALVAELLISNIHGLLMKNSLGLQNSLAQEDEIRKVAERVIGLKTI